jgi:hypothetical protein
MVTVKRSSELMERVKRVRQAAAEGDDEWFERSRGDGEVLAFGSAPGEEFRGSEQWPRMAAARQMNEDAGITDDEVEDERVEAFEAGDAGWIVLHGSFQFADGSRVPTRSISVLARDDDGSWKTVLISTHVLVPNEALQVGSPTLAALAVPSS